MRIQEAEWLFVSTESTSVVLEELFRKVVFGSVPHPRHGQS